MTTYPVVHPALVDQLAAIRQEAAGLVADIDTCVKPRPTHVVPPGQKLPGPVWEPAPGWTVRVIDPDEDGPCAVFVDHVQTWVLPNDLEAITPDTARRIGTALLAAADRAETVRHRP
jgi:hypothetical protein